MMFRRHLDTDRVLNSSWAIPVFHAVLAVCLFSATEARSADASDRTSGSLQLAERTEQGLILSSPRRSEALTLSLAAPLFQFFEGSAGGPSVMPRVVHPIANGRVTGYTAEYPPLALGAARLLIRVDYALMPDGQGVRKQAHLKLEADDPATQLTLKRVVLLDEPAPLTAIAPRAGIQSYPLFCGDWFCGVEYPFAEAVVRDGRAVLAHSPGRVLRPDQSYDTRTAVIGLAEPGRARQAFEAYIQQQRPHPAGMHFNYNSWWSLPIRYSEGEVRGLMRDLHRLMGTSPEGRFDTFTIDMGWSAREAVWQIDRVLMPQGFAPLNDEIAQQRASLGLWWSPNNAYSPSSFDNDWARRQGYPTFSTPSHLMCLGVGGKYHQAARQAIAGLVREYRLGQIKCDGYSPECAASDHGHLPGELSREAVADGMIDVLQAVREANPDVWIEATCFGYDPSPWWLLHADSVIGTYGDDAPHGIVPAPVYRESYSTTRDFFNLHSHDAPLPAAAQEVLGIIHQTPDPLYNDAVLCVMRGHQFISLYINPKFLRPQEGAFLSHLMSWTRAHADLLAHTRMILPEGWKQAGLNPHDMPRRTYGYAHWVGEEGVICLRNPWMAMDKVDLRLDQQSLDAPANIQNCQLMEIYPQRRVLKQHVSHGDALDVTLRPYEIKVLAVCRPQASEHEATSPVPQVEPCEVLHAEHAVKALEQTASSAPASAPTDSAKASPLAWKSQVDVKVNGQEWRLFYLIESPEPLQQVSASALVNDRPVEPRVLDSAQGWSAAGPAMMKNAWRWWIVPLDEGKAHIAMDIQFLSSDASASASAWLVNGALPDEIALDGAALSAVPATQGLLTFPTSPIQPLIASQAVIMPVRLERPPAVQTSRPSSIENLQGSFLNDRESRPPFPFPSTQWLPEATMCTQHRLAESRSGLINCQQKYLHAAPFFVCDQAQRFVYPFHPSLLPDFASHDKHPLGRVHFLGEVNQCLIVAWYACART